MKSMGDRVAARLKEMGQSQGWLARETGLKQPSINSLIHKPNAGSKYALKIAKALKVRPPWLVDGIGPKEMGETILVGKVGAGAEIYRFPDGVVLEGLDANPDVGGCLAAQIEGDSMLPFQNGWLVYYEAEHRGIKESCIGRLCVLEVKDGATLIKILRRGNRKGRFNLESWNATLREDVVVEWASEVILIKPK